MNKQYLKINHIPAVIWGEKKEKVFLAVHGNLSHKEDTVIRLLADEAVKKGYQVLSFDLPEHGERKEEPTPCKVQNAVQELALIMAYAKENWQEIRLFACSMGAYFSLLAYQKEPIVQALFLSPVVDMQRIIENMMAYCKVTPERLQKEGTINTSIGQKLYWDYYCYMKQHPICSWNIATKILYGAKDTLCEFAFVKAFAVRFQCGLEIIAEGEHYFHTEEQLTMFKQWLAEYIY